MEDFEVFCFYIDNIDCYRADVDILVVFG